jgi:hypothetical protein
MCVGGECPVSLFENLKKLCFHYWLKNKFSTREAWPQNEGHFIWKKETWPLSPLIKKYTIFHINPQK